MVALEETEKTNFEALASSRASKECSIANFIVVVWNCQSLIIALEEELDLTTTHHDELSLKMHALEGGEVSFDGML